MCTGVKIKHYTDKLLISLPINTLTHVYVCMWIYIDEKSVIMSYKLWFETQYFLRYTDFSDYIDFFDFCFIKTFITPKTLSCSLKKEPHH